MQQGSKVANYFRDEFTARAKQEKWDYMRQIFEQVCRE